MLYIFDKDGTVIKSVPKANGGTRPPNTLDEQEAFEDVQAKMDDLLWQGHHRAMASNQGGVAYGIMTYDWAVTLMQDARIKTDMDSWRMCPYHPKGTVAEYTCNHPDRKPYPGMLWSLMSEYGFLPEQTVYIGDMDSDREAAVRAGVKFEWAWEFFGREKP